MKLVNEQNYIMDNHEDYAPMRSEKTRGMMDKSEIAKGFASISIKPYYELPGNAIFQISYAGIKGISKVLTTETIQYPDIKALELSSFFIPKWVFRNTDIVEYREGQITYISDSPHQSTLEHKVYLDKSFQSDNENVLRNVSGSKFSKTQKKKRGDDGPLVPFEP